MTVVKVVETMRKILSHCNYSTGNSPILPKNFKWKRGWGKQFWEGKLLGKHTFGGRGACQKKMVRKNWGEMV